MSENWNIRPRARACNRCERPFADGETIHSCIVPGDERYERDDRCGACAAGNDLPAAVSRWTSRFIAPPPPPPEPIRRDNAEQILRSLDDRADIGAVNTRFVLALMLERKRILRQRNAFHREDNGARIIVYEHHETRESFLVEDPGLTPAQAAEVHAQVVTVLAAGEETRSGSDPADPADPGDPADPADPEGTADPADHLDAGELPAEEPS